MEGNKGKLHFFPKILGVIFQIGVGKDLRILKKELFLFYIAGIKMLRRIRLL